jgi:hypothetical protein
MDWNDRRIERLPKSGLVVWDPWLVIARKDTPIIRLDLRALDGIELAVPDDGAGSEVILVCGELEVGLGVADGPEAAERLVRDAAPLTRAATSLAAPADLSRMLFVDDDPVLLRDGQIQIGNAAFPLYEVRDYAIRGDNLPLPGGAIIQAAMALLVVAADDRDRPG